MTLRDLAEKTGCVRVVQQLDNELGYYSAGDSPDRSTLQLEPIGREVSFLVDESPDDGSSVERALGDALGRSDVRIELFMRRCTSICSSSRAATTIHLRRDQSSPFVSSINEDFNDCRVVGKRSPQRSGSGGSTGVGALSADAGAPDGG